MDCCCQASLSFTISWSLLKFVSIEWWCHPTISSSVTSLSSCPQSFPASGSFPMSWLFALGNQNIGTSASVLPMNIQGWFPLGLIGLISLLLKGLKSLLRHHNLHNLKASVLRHSAFFMVQLLQPYMTTGKTIALTKQTFVSKVVSLLFNMLFRLVTPGDLPDPGIEPRSPELQADALTSEPPGKPSSKE